MPVKAVQQLCRRALSSVAGGTFPRITPADNLVFDAVINALVCRMFPTPEHTSFFTRSYRDDRYPECLLRPPDGWRPSRPAGTPPALERMRAVAEVYRALYSETGAGYRMFAAP